MLKRKKNWKLNYNISSITLYESNLKNRPHCSKLSHWICPPFYYTVNKLLSICLFKTKYKLEQYGNPLMLKCWFLTQTLSLFYKLKTIFKTHIFILHIESYNFFILSSATLMSCLIFLLIKKTQSYSSIHLIFIYFNRVHLLFLFTHSFPVMKRNEETLKFCTW